MITETCPEELQHEIDETKSRLSARLETLGNQYNVAENVQQAGNAVAATVEAVQATAQVVNSAVDTLSTAADFEGHIRRHPWLCLGGAAATAYLVASWMNRPQSRSAVDQKSDSGSPTIETAPVSVSPLAAGLAGQLGSPAAVANQAYQSAMLQTSPGYHLKVLAMNMLIGVAREAAARAVPQITDLMMAHLNPQGGSDGQRERPRAD